MRRVVPAWLLVLGCWLGAIGVGNGQSRADVNGQALFLSGANLAWQSFANDVGPKSTTPDTNHFADVFSQIRSNGGNSLRLWLHTTGANTPAWNGAMITGPGNGTITDLRTITRLARERSVGLVLCLWSFDMLRISNGTNITTRAHSLLTNETALGSYVTNSLIPMVQALQGDPAIIAWEIFNEPEGMSEEFGWSFNLHVPMSAIQRFINRCAGAIHRTDPKAKVTNGSWSFYATTDVGAGNFNYYTDTRLIGAGGDPDGTLDLYTVHYYDWAGTERSPFQHPSSYWGLTKPLVVAEFFPGPPACVNCGPAAYETLYQNGYAGALAWSWTDSNPADMLAQMAAVAGAHPGDVLIVTNRPGNTPPVLALIPDRLASPGEWIRITNRVTDTDLPAQVLTFQLLQGPVESSLGPATGVVTWRPPVSRSGTTNEFEVRVSDSGTPSLSATNRWRVAVGPLLPVGLTFASGPGGLRLRVDGPRGPDYSLLRSTNLLAWDLIQVSNAPAVPFWWEEPDLRLDPAGGSRFYRVRLGP